VILARMPYAAMADIKVLAVFVVAPIIEAT
jgi:hypothetical protein